MEALKMPMREIRQKYTRSELALMAWRSSEMASNMEEISHSDNQGPGAPQSTAPYEGRNYAIASHEFQALEEKLSPIVYKMCDDKGNIDLRKLTGDEAMLYMGALGIAVPTMQGVPRVGKKPRS